VILIVTNRRDHTADFGVLEMQRRGVPYFRFNTEDFPHAARSTIRFDGTGNAGHLTTSRGTVRFDDVQSVWFRRPVMPKPADRIVDPSARHFSCVESLAYMEGLWKVLDCFWVSRPDRVRTAESKLLQLKVAHQLGFSIPRTLVTSDPDEARDFLAATNKVVYKPLTQGRLEYEEGAMLVFTNVVRDLHASELERVKYAPCLFQEYVPKRFEVRVTVFGTKVFATEIHSQATEEAKDDWRRSPARALPHRAHTLPHKIEAKSVRLVETLGLAFGAIDMVLTPQGDYVFLEINPNGQWAWIEQQTGQPMSRSLVDLLTKGRA
jgi:glutathione synthase/RimK-type ligase-like ATP-grasp enzyme